ncbi:MAG: tRNA (guanosine(46)-N7)-methyltransferase TrmB [Planctomycetota bacterium]|jgi:tRNA (guanine-N7-)-methyltransferase
MRPETPAKLSHAKQAKWNTAGILLDADALPTPVDFAEIFGNTRPVEIEIGTGKGTFLLARAKARPEANFLGIEYAKAYATYTADRFRRAQLTNIRMLRTEAASFFKTAVPAGSLQRVHIYYPDPWPKRRHNRRRLIQPQFVDIVRRTLAPGGQLIIITDHFDYARHIRRVLHEAPGFCRIPMPRMTDAEGELVGTNFERKYIAQGRPSYSLALMRYV